MSAAVIDVRKLTLAYGSRVIQQDVSFSVGAGDIFVIMGGSGCGKSSLLKNLLGLVEPASGEIYYGDTEFVTADEATRQQLRRGWGITYQSGGMFSAMTLAENVALPLELYTAYSKREIGEIVAYKLALVGLAGYQEYYPYQLSGGMQKRAALARAIALDPDILFFDEPSAGLDPISSRLLDDLIVQLQESTSATVVLVTHELASIFSIGTNAVYLDTASRTMIDYGEPHYLRDHSAQPVVRQFLNRSPGRNPQPGATHE